MSNTIAHNTGFGQWDTLNKYDTTRWLEFGQERYFISRANSQVQLLRRDGWQSVADFLREQPAGVTQVDRGVVINKGTLLPVRLVAQRCPEEVANRRKQKLYRTAKRKGESVSIDRLTMCEWTVLITNVPESMLTTREVWVVYRLRWQVESALSRHKRLLGSALRAKTHAARRRDCYLRVLTHNLMLLAAKR